MEPHKVAQAFGYLFDVGKDILFAGLDKATKTILCQLGDATNQVADSDQAELWQQPGFWSLPAPPTQGKPSCQAVVLKRSDRDIIIATRDLRSSAIYGNLKPGETCVGASVGQARTLYKANGAVVHYTTQNNQAGGPGVSSYTGPDKIQLVIGACSITLDPTAGITISTGAAAITLDPSGNLKVMGTQVGVQGSAVAIAGTVGTFLGRTPTAVTGVAYGPPGAGPVALASASVFVSPT
jgi:hypothetical protein